jgi:MoaA/NifB/PqqE/SkfB family radical SAM enzyme
MSDMFRYIDFETISTCNRTCPTCLRNSHPDREALQSWFELNLLPMEIIEEALEQCVEIGFNGPVWLSHYNEPLMDKRIPQIAEMVKDFNHFSMVALNTNGDFINEELAEELDGKLDKMIVTLYMDEPTKSYRAGWIKSLFHSTHVEIITQSEHIATHFSPAFDITELIKKNHMKPCSEPQIRVIINQGTFPETSIKDFWFGEYHMKILNDLKETGGRLRHPYCATCPRP